MPFRERVKRVLHRTSPNSSADGSGTTSPRQPTEKEIEKWNRQNLPPSRLRRPVDPVHKKNLEAFSFGSAFRRRSETSQFSPFASRKNSSAISRKSMQSQRRGDSVSGVEKVVEKVVENVDDEADVASVGGISRKLTHGTDSTQQPESIVTDELDASMNPAIKLNSEQPFSQKELDLALKKSKSKNSRFVV